MEKTLGDYKYWLALGRNVRFTAALFQEIHALSVPIDTIFHLSEARLISLGLTKRCIKELIYSREKFNIEKVLLEIKNNQIEPVFIFEDDYPDILRNIYDPPFIIYKKGSANLNQICIGVVGSRRPTDYGVEATRKLTTDLSGSGITIISGLAIGIDTVAHQATLDNGGSAIAVLGCGLNQIYPSSNLQLSRSIVSSGGAIISEYPFDTKPAKQNFPARNRIISGLSQGLLVTEAAESSGSLITAISALNQDREVFAVPGSIFSLSSAGTNNLIRAGAHICTKAQDVFDELGIQCPESVVSAREIIPRNREERLIAEFIRSEPRHIDEISNGTGLSQTKTSSTLTMMELSAKVKHIGGNIFRLNN